MGCGPISTHGGIASSEHVTCGLWSLRCRPRPPGNCFEPGYPVGCEPPLGVGFPLHAHPLAKSIAIFHVASRNASMPLALDESFQVAEAFLPLIGRWIPDPAADCFESSDLIGSQLPGPVSGPLVAHPAAEQIVATFDMALRHEGMPLALDESVQVSEAFLPLVGKWIPAIGQVGSHFPRG